MVRALRSHRRDHWFESSTAHKKPCFLEKFFFNVTAVIGFLNRVTVVAAENCPVTGRHSRTLNYQKKITHDLSLM